MGTDVREHYGIGKYRPPVKFHAGDSEAAHPLFHRYTDIENLRNFPEVFADGEEVVVTEKIHGTNSRIGYVEGSLLAGSHGLQVRTAGRPPNVRPSAARIRCLPESTKRVLATGIKKAQAPIMIGKAATGSIPIRLTRIMHGA